MTSSDEAVDRLTQGNLRFLDALAGQRPSERPLRLGTQEPFAAVVSCSDGRVVPEAVFDAAIGDLFVVRVAGNVVGPSQAGSLELVRIHHALPLVLVLGHTDCAAVTAALASIRGERLPGSASWSTDLESLLGPIRAAILTVLGLLPTDRAAAVGLAVEANVRARVADVQRLLARPGASPAPPAARVAGAVYDVASGAVRFLDDPSTRR